MWELGPRLRRRALLLAGLTSTFDSQALPPKTLVFPGDHGSHPDFRTEWWYVTGYAYSGARELGFQVTFFRTRVEATQGMRSRFAAKQLVFAHAAVTDVQGNRLLHDQRIAREGFDAASAATSDTAVRIGNWSLVRMGEQYQAGVSADGFKLNLTLTPTQALLLQGDNGLSRKGPDEQQASYYYSQPQLSVTGTVSIGGKDLPLTGSQGNPQSRGKAWLDHEWSQELLHPDAVGWDWVGINFFDGSALTAFQLRDKGGAAIWDGGSFRASTGQGLSFKRSDVAFTPQRSWKSTASQTTYPVVWAIRTPADTYTVKAVIDNQELDSRMSTGAIYWEGLSDVFDSRGQHVGRGYLEMTGYASALRL